MKDTSSLHLKVQELCDCFATVDPLTEMTTIESSDDREEAALKWLALAALHGINNNAEKIAVQRSKDGRVKVVAEYRKTELPSPGEAVGEKIIEALRGITHIEGDTGKTLLALGIRDSSIELKIKLKAKDGGQKATLTFP